MVAVVRKLFSAVEADAAFFGEKDLQQLAVIRRLAEEEFVGLEIVGCPLVRESDGLAMSSRNVRLEGAFSPRRSRALRMAQTASKTRRAPMAISNPLLRDIESEASEMAGVQLEYIDVVNAKTFEPLHDGPFGKKGVCHCRGPSWCSSPD